MKRLKDESHSLAPDARALRIVERSHVDAAQCDRAGVWHVEAGHQIEECRFADARLAHDRDERTIGYFEADATQDLPMPHASIRFLDVAQDEHRHFETSCDASAFAIGAGARI